jgi:hypothetical protein
MVLGINLMIENPLTGLGFNMHSLAFPERGLGWQGIHSAFIQAGADLGIPGFLVFLGMVYQAFRAVRLARARFQSAPGQETGLALATGIELGLVAFTVGGFLLPVAYRFYFYYLAGFAVALQHIAASSIPEVRGSDAPASMAPATGAKATGA